MREVIHTDEAPAAVGPYSQAIRSDHYLFLSGQIGLHPGTGELAEGFEAQAEQVLDNLQAVCAAAGTALGQAVKLTVYLTDLGDFAAFNAMMAERFSEAPPARATVQVAALPLGAVVEMDAIIAL